MILSVDGIPVNYTVSGSGENILILQGWGTNIGLYSGLIGHLSARFRVIAPDLPGFGKTPEPPRAWDAEDYADFCEKFISLLGIKKLSLIGHSNGGRIIIRLVTGKKRCFEVSRLVFIDSAGIVRQSGKKSARQLAFKVGKSVLSLPGFKKLFPSALDGLRSHFGSADYKSASPVMRDTLVRLVNADLRELLPQISLPSLLLWGENDTDTPVEDGKLMEKLIPDSGLVVVPGAGHYSYLERPDFTYRVLDSFFGVL